MLWRSLLFATTMLLALAPVAPLGAQGLDLSKRFQVLARKDTGRLQSDLNKAGQNGIQIVTGSFTGSDEVAVLLRQSEDKSDRFEYLVIAEKDKTKAEQRLRTAASQGYRLMPNTVTAKGKTFGGSDLVMIMEKRPGQAKAHEYMLLDTTLGSAVQVSLVGAVDQGYNIVGMIKRDNSYLLILEK